MLLYDKIAHFRVLVCLCVKTSRSAKPFFWKCVSATNSLSCKSKSFSYEKYCTKTRFETEANQNSEMGYYIAIQSPYYKWFFSTHFQTVVECGTYKAPSLFSPHIRSPSYNPGQNPLGNCISSKLKYNWHFTVLLCLALHSKEDQHWQISTQENQRNDRDRRCCEWKFRNNILVTAL